MDRRALVLGGGGVTGIAWPPQRWTACSASASLSPSPGSAPPPETGPPTPPT